MQSEFIFDTVPTTNPEVIANSFKDFFVNVGKNLAENIKSDIDPLKYIANNIRSINTIEVTEDKILSIISAMNNSAPDFDELPAFIMKQCFKLSAWPEVRGTADTDGGAYSPFRSILLVLTHDFIIIQLYGPACGDG